MYQLICTIVSLLGRFLISLFGGWDTVFQTLVIFMVVDYISAFITASIVLHSLDTNTDSLNGKFGLLGLCKKGMTLLFILISHRLDIAMGVDYIRTTVVICFITNEAVSIIENAEMMGMSIPPVLLRVIDLLKRKSAAEDKEERS